jgi:ribokinase
VASGRLGALVSFCGCIGDDSDGALLLSSLKSAKVDLQYLHRINAATGAAGILVDDQGTNVIVVAPGANGHLTPDLVNQAVQAFKPAFVLAQLEIPDDAVGAASLCEKFILNPAPARPISDEVLSRCHAITPNETELQFLTGIFPRDEKCCREAAWALLDRGVENVVVTLGDRGSQWVSRKESRLFTPPPVTAIDTTAAGDVFNGALVTFLAEGRDMSNAIELANHVAALSTTRVGAQSSAPTRSDVKAFAPALF